MSLVPCPFCGDKMPYLIPKSVMGNDGHCMFCGTCGTYGPFDTTIDGAVKKWNQREIRICYNCKHRDREYCFLTNQTVFLTESCMKWEGEYEL